MDGKLERLGALDAEELERVLGQLLDEMGGLVGDTERALAGELVRRARDRDAYLDAYVKQMGRAERLSRALEAYVKDHDEKRWPDERPCPCWLCREARAALG